MVLSKLNKMAPVEVPHYINRHVVRAWTVLAIRNLFTPGPRFEFQRLCDDSKLRTFKVRCIQNNGGC